MGYKENQNGFSRREWTHDHYINPDRFADAVYQYLKEQTAYESNKLEREAPA